MAHNKKLEMVITQSQCPFVIKCRTYQITRDKTFRQDCTKVL